jgi:hypothetical protein
MPLSKRVCRSTKCLTSSSTLIFSFLGPRWVDRAGENLLAPGQDYRPVVAVPPNGFPSMFLLSKRRCADARRRFSPVDLVVSNERFAYSVFKKIRIMRCVDVPFSVRKSLIKTPWDSQNAGHIFYCRNCSLPLFSNSIRPFLNDLIQSYLWVLENVLSPNCALSFNRVSSGFTFQTVRNLK